MLEPICGLPYLARSAWLPCLNAPVHDGPHGVWVPVQGVPLRFCAQCRQVLECLCGLEQWTTTA